MVCALLFVRLFVALKRARARAKAFRVKKSEGRTVKNIRSRRHPNKRDKPLLEHQLFTFFGSIFTFSLFFFDFLPKIFVFRQRLSKFAQILMISPHNFAEHSRKC